MTVLLAYFDKKLSYTSTDFEVSLQDSLKHTILCMHIIGKNLVESLVKKECTFNYYVMITNEN